METKKFIKLIAIILACILGAAAMMIFAFYMVSPK
jgi:flagellar basal body-associated protein FliL